MCAAQEIGFNYFARRCKVTAGGDTVVLRLSIDNEAEGELTMINGFDGVAGCCAKSARGAAPRRSPLGSLSRHLARGTALGFAALVMVGCTGTADGPPSTPPPSPSDTWPSPVRTPAPPPPALEGLEEWSRWRPTEPVRDFVPLPESEKLRIRSEQLAGIAQGFELVNPPDIPLERWVTYEEITAAQGQCYGEFGLEIVPDRVGSFKFVSELSDKERGPTLYTCTARFTLDPDVAQPATRDQARVYYEYYTTVQVPCLRALGVEVPDPPSLAEFLDLHAAGKWWMPEEHLNLDDRPTEMEAALAACPPVPPWAALSGQG